MHCDVVDNSHPVDGATYRILRSHPASPPFASSISHSSSGLSCPEDVFLPLSSGTVRLQSDLHAIIAICTKVFCLNVCNTREDHPCLSAVRLFLPPGRVTVPRVLSHHKSLFGVVGWTPWTGPWFVLVWTARLWGTPIGQGFIFPLDCAPHSGAAVY